MASVVVTLRMETLEDDEGRTRIARVYIDGSDRTVWLCGLTYPEDEE